MRRIAIVGVLLPLLGAGATAWAHDDAPPINSGDTAWMLVATALVLMMTLPGVALFYAGMVRRKNVLATMMQSVAIASLVTVLWMVAGYSLAFTEGGPVLGDLSRVFLIGIDTHTVHSLAKTVPEGVYLTFQLTFAVITCALIAGAVADRMKFSALLVFIGVWLLVVYVPVAHWVWVGGFLASAGVLDYAGGTVVHINAGIAGLVAALMLGRRRGYGSENMAPHNLSLAVIGAGLLWVGWFGFNAGSAVAADGRAGMAMAVTQIAAAAAALSWMTAEWVVRGRPSVLGIASGAVAGLVAITPASGFVLPSGALAIGLIAGAVCFWAATSLKRRLGYDDSLDVFGVHAVGGIVGALLTGVFAVGAVSATADSPDGLTGWIDGNPEQLLVQLYGVAVTVAYSGLASAILFLLVDKVMGARVSEDEEREGLDLALHGESLH